MMVNDIGSNIIETTDGLYADRVADAKNPDGSFMYNKPQYDVDRHVYILIKARPRVKAQ